MECVFKSRLIALDMHVVLMVALISALTGFDSPIAVGQTGSSQNDSRQTTSTQESAATHLPKPTIPTQGSIVRFGAGENQTTQGFGESGVTSQSVVRTPSTIIPQDTKAKLVAARRKSQFDSDAAYGYLKDICKIGPRPSASRGMEKQQKYIRAHFEGLGAKYFEQSYMVKSPYDGRQVELKNLLIQWHPERTKRLLICCHHDTRPFADADKRNPRAKFIGANDGGSGVALLCELGKHIASMDGKYGVDFMFFDGEEFVIVRQRDPMFLGSSFFAKKYAQGVPEWRYEQAILVDMVGDKDLQIYLEGNSMKFAQSLTQDIWAVAKKLGVKEFIPEQKQFIRDDHLALNEIAKIPTCDIIDFDFPNPTQGNSYWHTRQDKIQNCSAESLGKVGMVVLAWIRQKQQLK